MPKRYLLVILFVFCVLPAFAAVEPRLAGDWKTQGPDGNELTFHLESNGRYTKTSGGQVIERGEMTAINRNWSSKSDTGLQDNGTFSVVANELVLRSTVNSTLRWQKGPSSNSSTPKPSAVTPKYNGQVSTQSTYKSKPTSNFSKPLASQSSISKNLGTPTTGNTNPLAPSTKTPTIGTSYPSPYNKTASSNPLAQSTKTPNANPIAQKPPIAANTNPLATNTSTQSLPSKAKNLVSNIAQSGLANSINNQPAAPVTGYQRKPRGWQGMAPNKGQRVGTPWGFPNQPGSPTVFGGGLKASIGNIINAAKSYGIKKAIDQAGTTALSQSGQTVPVAPGTVATPVVTGTPSSTSLTTVAANPLASSPSAPSGTNDPWTPRRKPNSLAKGPVEWDLSGNWAMVDTVGKSTMFHILEDGRYYITSGGFHVEAGSIKAANGKWALTSQTGRKDSGTFSATDYQLEITSQSAGSSKWARVGKKIPEPVKKAKSNQRPKRSGFSSTYGGYTEYYGGGRMRHWNRGH